MAFSHVSSLNVKRTFYQISKVCIVHLVIDAIAYKALKTVITSYKCRSYNKEWSDQLILSVVGRDEGDYIAPGFVFFRIKILFFFYYHFLCSLILDIFSTSFMHYHVK